MLHDRVVFITGATSGIGRATAAAFAKAGASLVLTGRKQMLLDEVAALCRPAKVHTAILDVRDNEAVKDLVANLPKDFVEIDVLVNNAGGALGLEPSQEANMEDWETMVDANIKGVLYCTHATLPGMVARNRGHIVNIGSIAGSYFYPGANVYGGTKAFVKQFSMNLRADLLGADVRVTNIEPGMLGGSDFSLTRFHGDKAKAAAVYEGIDALTPEDAAEAIVWCVSRPPHVNINRLELMPTMQAFAPLAVKRKQ